MDYNIGSLAGMFFVLFFAFFSGQNYVTSVLGSARGDLSLGLIYSFLCVAAVFTPALFDAIKGCIQQREEKAELAAEKYALVLGSLLYAPFFGSCATDLPAFQLISSAALGIGAAMLWVAQGSILTACSDPARRERDAGIFWCGYMGGNAVGNFSAYLIKKQCDVSVLFCLLCGICVVSSILGFIFISPRTSRTAIDVPQPVSASEPPDSQEAAPAKEQSSFLQHAHDDVIALFSALQLRQVCVLLPMLVFIGFENSFWAGEFTQLLDEDEIGAVLAVLGVFEVIAGLSMGAGGAVKRWVMLGCLAFACGFLLIVFEKNDTLTSTTIGGTSLIMYIAAGCFGVGDALFNTICIAQLGRLSEDQGLFNRRTAFVLFQSFNTMFNAIGYYVAPAWPVHGSSGTLIQIYTLGGILLVATSLFVINSSSKAKEDFEVDKDDTPPELLRSKLMDDSS